jgi:hypothetical protein
MKYMSSGIKQDFKNILKEKINNSLNNNLRLKKVHFLLNNSLFIFDFYNENGNYFFKPLKDLIPKSLENYELHIEEITKEPTYVCSLSNYNGDNTLLLQDLYWIIDNFELADLYFSPYDYSSIYISNRKELNSYPGWFLKGWEEGNKVNYPNTKTKREAMIMINSELSEREGLNEKINLVKNNIKFLNEFYLFDKNNTIEILENTLEEVEIFQEISLNTTKFLWKFYPTQCVSNVRFIIEQKILPPGFETWIGYICRFDPEFYSQIPVLEIHCWFVKKLNEKFQIIDLSTLNPRVQEGISLDSCDDYFNNIEKDFSIIFEQNLAQARNILKNRMVGKLPKDLIYIGKKINSEEFLDKMKELKEVDRNTILSALQSNSITKNKIEKMTKIGRNELCPCGSGKKYKKCCGAN